MKLPCPCLSGSKKLQKALLFLLLTSKKVQKARPKVLPKHLAALCLLELFLHHFPVSDGKLQITVIGPSCQSVDLTLHARRRNLAILRRPPKMHQNHDDDTSAKNAPKPRPRHKRQNSTMVLLGTVCHCEFLGILRFGCTITITELRANIKQTMGCSIG